MTKPIPTDASSAPRDLPDDRIGRYTAPQIAETLGVDSSTVRKCRWPWLVKAVAERRLKASNGKFTALALALFADYQARVVSDRAFEPDEWVEVTRDAYPAPAEPVEAEVVDDYVAPAATGPQFTNVADYLESHALDLTRQSDAYDTRLARLQATGEGYLERLTQVNLQLSLANADKSTQELEAALSDAYNGELERLAAVEAAKVKARIDFADRLAKSSPQG